MIANRPHPARVVAPALPVVVFVLSFISIPTELVLPNTQKVGDILDLRLDLVDIMANVLGFIPLGVVLAGRGLWPVLGIAASASMFAETTQLFSSGRSPSLVDVVMNVIGAAVGAALCSRWKLSFGQVAIRKRSALLAGALALAYVGLGARVTPDDIEITAGLLLDAPPWRPVNARGVNSPGRLEARWTFDKIDGDSVPDASGNGLDGALLNRPGLASGVDGGAIRLNGLNQYVDAGDPVALRITGDLTLSAWINSTAFPRDDAAIVSSFNGLGYQLDTTIDQGPRTIGFKLADSSGRPMIRYGRTPLALNRWYHLAGVYDAAAQTLNVYLNGRPDDGCQLGHVTNRQHFSGPRHVFLGRHGSNEGFEFAGSIDDVRIYSRALTAREIEAEVMSAGASVSPPDAAAVAEGYAPDAPRDERCLATPWVILAMQRTVLAMRGTDIESTDARVAGLIVSSGMLVAIACLGLWPSAGYRVPSLVLSFLCGCLLVPSISPVVPPLFLWIVPLLTLVGGASVVVSTRSDAQ